MLFPQIAPHIFECQACPSPCDGKSKGSYIFENDLALSERYENKIMDYICSKGVYNAQKAAGAGFPDIEVVQMNGEIKAYVEVKVQQRTFMRVADSLPLSDLLPSETLALNLSDLKRYFNLYDLLQKPIYVVWVLLNRPCILGERSYKLYAQKIEVLRELYGKYADKRRFHRKSGNGDVVDGAHLGVVINYHFSLNELQQWDITL